MEEDSLASLFDTDEFLDGELDDDTAPLDPSAPVQLLSNELANPVEEPDDDGNPLASEPDQLPQSHAPIDRRPVIRNVVCNVHTSCPLDVRDIAMRLRNTEFNPRRFPSAIFRLRSPKTTHMIFPSGRICCVGAKTEEDGRTALRKVVRLLQKIGYPSARLGHFRIQTIMGNCNVGFPIRLEGLALAHGAHCRYEPEVFCGLVYRLIEPTMTLLIFVSGRIIFTGAKDRRELLRAYELIYDVVHGFRAGASDAEAQRLRPDHRAVQQLRDLARDRRRRRRAPRDEELMEVDGIDPVRVLPSPEPGVVVVGGGGGEGIVEDEGIAGLAWRHQQEQREREAQAESPSSFLESLSATTPTDEGSPFSPEPNLTPQQSEDPQDEYDEDEDDFFDDFFDE